MRLHHILERLTNTGLRLGTLLAKLALTFYMSRYFILSDIGVYGLVFGVVIILGVLLGIKLDYAVSRELVGGTPIESLSKMRDQIIFAATNYAGLALIMVLIAVTHAFGVSNLVLFYIFALSVTENLCNISYTNIVSMGRPLLANMLYFVRAGLWVLPVILLGSLDPTRRTVDVVLIAWLFGTICSLMMTLWIWQGLPWSALRKIPVNWGWIKSAVYKGAPIWLGTLGLAGGVYVDRFIVMQYLGIDNVGIATIYFSFANSLISLVQSGVLSFNYPRLIMFHREKDFAGFNHEAWQAEKFVALFAAVFAIVIGTSVPLIGHLFHRPILAEQAPTLWFMLLGVWIRANAETLYNILFARHQDRAVWLGNLLFIIPACGCNAIFVPQFGLIGIGYGAIVAALCLFGWRLWHVWKYSPSSLQ